MSCSFQTWRSICIKVRLLAGLAIIAAVLVCLRTGADDYASLRQRVRELGRLTAPPAVHSAEGFAEADGIRPLLYDGLPYRSKPTRVFAWYGAPAGRTGRVPGIVLLHGGGGTAYREWVKKWNEHGFAAIAVALEGQTDERVERAPATADSPWKRHPWAGPARNGIYGDSDQPLADQWMYHAVADAVLANSLIRSFPEIDTTKVGVTGISWGGVIASTVVGIDTRFAFAIPTYGCGSLADADNQWGKALHDNSLYREVWDPVVWLPNARMPAFWFTWLADVHFPLTSQSASYRAAAGPRMVAVLKDMKHSHPAGWNPPDSYAFAVAVVREGRPWLRQESQRRADGKAMVEFSSAKPIDGGVLFSTAGSGFTGRRKWIETAATVGQYGTRVRVVAELPADTRAWFMNVRAGGLTASSDFVE
jgi:dienelactone hydrolase